MTGIGETLIAGAVDYGDAVIMPGVIDAHVHINEPGRTEWEGFETATLAAAAGGVTTIVDMPLNSSPVTTNVEALKAKMQSTTGKLHVNVGFYGGLVPGNLHEISSLAEAGVLGIKCFLTHSGIDDFPDVPVSLLRDVLPLLSDYSIPLLVHCELSGEEEHLEKHFATYDDYLKSRPDKWETAAIVKVIEAAAFTGGWVHVVHVSSAESLPLIRDARLKGITITAETCPHYILFNADQIPDKQTVYKCAPPIRSRENNDKLAAALKDGTLNFIASDHSPAPPALKEIDTGDLVKAWGGIAGLQFLLSTSYTSLKGHMTLEDFIPLLTEKPAEFLQLNKKKGYLKIGYDADICIWNPEISHVVASTGIHHRHKASPYIGQELYGKVLETIVDGQTVFSNDSFNILNAGKWVLRK